MTKRKNALLFIAVIILIAAFSVFLMKKSIIDIEKIKSLGDDFQYNVISMSSIIGGFLFTGISILISVIDKESIKRLWDNHYLDNLYRTAFVGMLSNIVSLVSSLVLLCFTLDKEIIDTVIQIEIVSLIYGLSLFAWCIKKLISIIIKLKPKDE